ncbi:MAG: patatin-like phospholipase family protein [Caulobacteraceae bacterium]|nr:patatin-like phospholipase family protein [Caulobacteraceae bacterium]
MTADAYARPTDDCDLVLKGGVTSGVVYPQAILALARRYRFCSIGGTSVGAIAAAFAAAAEFARRRGDPAGFERLDVACAELPRLMPGLFQPKPMFRPLMTLIRWAQRRPRALAGVGLAVTALVLLLAASGATLSWLSPQSPALPLVCGALFAALALCGAGAAWVGVTAARLPAHDFGLCPGGATRPGGPPALTDWVHATIQHIAFGREGEPPLTFGRLREAGVELKMVVTNLSMRRPHTLPGLGEDLPLMFDAGEWGRLFPAEVVDFLTEEAADPVAQDPGAPRGLVLHQLPSASNMPVIVGVRMSLAFPFLLAAVPLWLRDRWLNQLSLDQVGAARPMRYRAPTTARLRRILISDGGISSNFPIHFFDTLFPDRPTFALGIDALDPAIDPDGPRAYVPRGAEGASFMPARDIGGFAAFAAAILGAAKDWQDLLAGSMPGQRERIARVFLSPEEGGLSLDMPAELSRRLMAYGGAVGQAVLDDFDFAEHRWRRALSVYGVLQGQAAGARAGWDGGFGAWLSDYTPRTYVRALAPASREALNARLAAFAALGEIFDPALSLSEFPKPRGVMRITPRV